MEDVSGMKFYELTELSTSILNDIVSAYTRLEFKEEREHIPNRDLIREYDVKRSEVFRELCKSDNFKSIDSMNSIIETYLPLHKQLHNHE